MTKIFLYRLNFFGSFLNLQLLTFQINWMHPLLKNFKITDEKIDDMKTEQKLIKVDDYLAITEPVSAIFRNQCGKGDLMDKTQVRQIITAYVKSMVSYIFAY